MRIFYFMTGPRPDSDEFAHPLRTSGANRHNTLAEAVADARIAHEQFGDAFAVWIRDVMGYRVIGRCDTRGYVPLAPEGNIS